MSDYSEEYRKFVRHIYSVIYRYQPYANQESIFDYDRDYDVPGTIDIRHTTDLSYAFSDYDITRNRKNLITIRDNWDTSHVRIFRGLFLDSRISTKIIQNLDVSKGTCFDEFFCDASDEDDFKYLRNMDFSKGDSYIKMFKGISADDKTYENISKMNVNPNASFKRFFSELPRDSAEHFRKWFPDMNIDDIVKKLTEKPYW